MKTARAALVLWALLAWALPVAAQLRDSVPAWRVAQPERPTVATHAYPVAPGVVEIETGAQLLRPAGGSELDAPFVLKLGVAPPVQLEIESGWTRRRPAGVAAGGAGSALSDVAFAAKVRLLAGAPVLASFSIQPSLKLPTGRQGLSGTGTTDAGLLLISSRTLGRLSLDLNAGATWRSGDGADAPRTASLLTASAGLDLGHNVVWDTELFDFPGTSGPAGARPQVGLLTGPTFAVRPWLVLDAGIVANVAGLPANAAYSGLTWNVGRIRGWREGR